MSSGPIDRRLILEPVRARRGLIVTGALGAADAALLVAAAALLASCVTAAALGHRPLSSLTGRLVALAAVLAARALVHGAGELDGRLAAVAVMSGLRARLIRRLLVTRPGRRPAGLRTGELAAAAVGGVDALEVYLADYLPQLVRAAIVPPLVIAAVAWRDPLLGAIMAATVPLLVVFMILVGRDTAARTRARHRTLALLSAHFLDVVTGLSTLRAHRREDAQRAALATVGERYRAETMATLRLAFMSALVLELVATISTALLAATIGVQLCAGALSLDVGLFVLLLAPEVYGPLREVGRRFHAGADASAAADRIFAALEDESAPVAAVAVAPDPSREAVVLSDVTVRYAPDREPALSDLSLVLPPGTTTVLCGPSGIGKSTIAALVCGLLTPSCGHVRCAGVDLADVDGDAWRARVGWLAQRPVLFDGTLADNLRLGAPHAGADAMRAALDAAGAGELLAGLPDGLDTVVGPSGRRLSAGQRQRVALAAVWLSDARLVVLDEPTAHLDPETAAAIAPALGALLRGRTALLITHDPVLIGLGDHVVELGAPAMLAVAA